MQKNRMYILTIRSFCITRKVNSQGDAARYLFPTAILLLLSEQLLSAWQVFIEVYYLIFICVKAHSDMFFCAAYWFFCTQKRQAVWVFIARTYICFKKVGIPFSKNNSATVHMPYLKRFYNFAQLIDAFIVLCVLLRILP